MLDQRVRRWPNLEVDVRDELGVPAQRDQMGEGRSGKVYPPEQTVTPN